MISTYRKQLSQHLLDYRTAKETLASETTAVKSCQERLQRLLEAQGLFQQIAKQIQDSAHTKICRIVTKCLRVVFGEEAYEFKIAFRKLRGKTEARLLLVRDGHELEDPVNEAGGGPLDVVCLALRICKLVLSYPQRRRFLQLDEPMKNLSPEYRPLVPDLFLKIAKELKIQFLITTNQLEIACGTVVKLGGSE